MSSSRTSRLAYTAVLVPCMAGYLALLLDRAFGGGGILAFSPWLTTFSVPGSILTLLLLVQRAISLHDAVKLRLTSTGIQYGAKVQGATILSNQGFSLVFRILILTNVVSLLPGLYRSRKAKFGHNSREMIVTEWTIPFAWFFAVSSAVIAAAVLVLTLTQERITYSFIVPTERTSLDSISKSIPETGKKSDTEQDEDQELKSSSKRSPVQDLRPHLLKLTTQQWYKVASTSRRHDIYVRTDSEKTILEAATALSPDHPLHDPSKLTTLSEPYIRISL
ncbi:hypothetical protein BCV70DRAFT_201840 [Testicularia cyperi]|uniref:Uncharacterized protein n=1 Tax=Testicularia cyperi TaxID=1882483 RepID=A0A317XMD0_9BASI|nr:hypothetical protein BCV70DRAFT_201840 [Testicularia cyperi]